MRVIRLNGELGKKYGRVHKLDVRTPAEAIRALFSNFPEMERDLITSSERGLGYRCIVDRERVDEDGLTLPMSKSFSITPVVTGGGKVVGIILGVALIGVALVATGGLAGVGIAGFGGAAGGAATFATSIGFAGITYGSVALMGAALVLGGIAQLLAPVPKMQEQKRDENRYFNGPANVALQGAAVPVGYGRCVVGSVLVSAGITVIDENMSNSNGLFKFGDPRNVTALFVI